MCSSYFNGRQIISEKNKQHADSSRTRLLTESFVSLFAALNHDIPRNTSGIIIIATAQSSAAVHPLLHTLHVFKRVVVVKAPDRSARKEVRRLVISYPKPHFSSKN